MKEENAISQLDCAHNTTPLSDFLAGRDTPSATMLMMEGEFIIVLLIVLKVPLSLYENVIAD